MKRHTLINVLKKTGVATMSALALGAGVTGCASKSGILGAPGVPPPVTAPTSNNQTQFHSPTPAYTGVTTMPSIEDIDIRQPANDGGPIIDVPDTVQPSTVIAPPPIAEPPVTDLVVEPPTTAKAPALPVAEPPPLTYKVEKNDNLWKIGRMYGVSMQEIAAVNNRDLNAVLAEGTVLKLPPGARFVPESERPPIKKPVQVKRPAPPPAEPSTTKYAASKPVPSGGKYTVQPGDTLSEIAKMFGLSVKGIMDMNELKDSKIFPKQTLIVGAGTTAATQQTPPTATQQKTPSAAADATGENATPGLPDEDLGATAIEEGEAIEGETAATDSNVRVYPHWCLKGDTLESIAEMYETKVDWILKSNPGITSETDLEGKKLDVPVVNK